MRFPKELIPELERRYSSYWWKDDEELNYNEIVADPFKNLIFTILSQNTSSNNTRRAYISLKRRYHISPQVLSQADPKELSQIIRPGGLKHKVQKDHRGLQIDNGELWRGSQKGPFIVQGEGA